MQFILQLMCHLPHVVTDSISLLPVWREQMAENRQPKAEISPGQLRILVAPAMDGSQANSRPNT
jgi:hypothetical protein